MSSLLNQKPMMKCEMLDNCCGDLEPYQCRYCLFTTSFFVDLKQHVRTCCAFDAVYIVSKIEYDETAEPDIAMVSQQQPANIDNQSNGTNTEEGHLITLQRSHKHPAADQVNFVKTKLQQHIEALQCEYCEYRTTFGPHLENHMIVKHSSKSDWLKCSHCDYKTKLPSAMRRHDRTMHRADSEIKWYNCTRCEHRAKSNSNLQQHIIYKHASAEDIQWHHCHLCDYKGKTKQLLLVHLKHVHEKRRRKGFKCEQCSYQSTKRLDLEAHYKREHLNQRDFFSCTQCDFRSKWKNSLKQHEISRHGDGSEMNWYNCDQCSFRATQKSKLKLHHISKHFAEDQIQWHSCDLCEYRGKIKSSLTRHVAKAHGKSSVLSSDQEGKRVEDPKANNEQQQLFKCGTCEYTAGCRNIVFNHIVSSHLNNNFSLLR